MKKSVSSVLTSEELDIVIGTHPHADHIGGLINVMEAIAVKEVIDPGVVHTTKTFEDLQLIVHIGADRAQEIISLRPFSSIDDLTRVTGIGPSRLQDIKDQGIAYVD